MPISRPSPVSAVASSRRARPKSASQGPSGSSRMLAGVTSRCTSPAAWAASRPAAMAVIRPTAPSRSIGPVGEALGERAAAREGHREIAAPLALTAVEDRHHAGMVERRQGLALAPEPHPEAPIGPERRVDHLDRGDGARARRDGPGRRRPDRRRRSRSPSCPGAGEPRRGDRGRGQRRTGRRPRAVDCIHAPAGLVVGRVGDREAVPAVADGGDSPARARRWPRSA